MTMTQKMVELERMIPNNRKKKVRYALVTLRGAAEHAAVPAFFHQHGNSELRAIVDDDPEVASHLAEKYGVRSAYSHDNYERCLESGEIDAVYIALPNSMHRPYAIAAAHAGIHVLCDKPMAIEVADCLAMIDAAEANGIKLMVAYRLHFERTNLHAIETVRSGKIGEPRLFNSVFSQQVPRGNVRLKRKLGGGPVWDVGIYCINAARYFFQSEPEEVFAFKATGEDKRFREVEESVTAMIRFPGARLATFSCSFGASDVAEYQIIGTKGHLRSDSAFGHHDVLRLNTTIGEHVRERIFPKSDQFAPDLFYFSDCILNDRDPQPSGREGLADVRIIRAVYESLETGQPVHMNRTNTAEFIASSAVSRSNLSRGDNAQERHPAA